MASQDTRHQVFLSYSRADSGAAEIVVAACRKAGLTVWYDQMIPPNRDWAGAIVENLERSDIMVILFSSHSNASTQLARELAVADARKMLVYPVFTEDVTPQGGYAYRLATEQRFRLYPQPAQRAEELAEELKRHLSVDVSAASTSIPPASAARVQQFSEPIRHGLRPPLERLDWAIITAMIVLLCIPVFFISRGLETLASILFWLGMGAALVYTFRTQVRLDTWRRRLILDGALALVGFVAMAGTLQLSVAFDGDVMPLFESAYSTALLGFVVLIAMRLILSAGRWVLQKVNAR